jgi:hypothetical protein
MDLCQRYSEVGNVEVGKIFDGIYYSAVTKRRSEAMDNLQTGEE